MECFVERLKQTKVFPRSIRLQPHSFEAQSFMRYLIGRTASNQSDALVLSNPDMKYRLLTLAGRTASFG